MYLKYLGHACFYLKESNFSVVIDPFANVGYDQDFCTANYCICSHEHFDHCTLTKVSANKVITQMNVNEFPFGRFINSYHDEAMGTKRGKNLISVINLDGFKVCHFGDLGEPVSDKLINEIGKIDILLIPIGSVYTIDHIQAYEYVKKLSPKIVIPMHYKTPRGNIDINGKGDFLKLFDRVKQSSREFEITKLPTELIVYDINDQEF